MIIVQALPMALVLFILFPRIEAPRWMLFNEQRQAKTGLSGSMEPGSISSLGISGELVFRVKFSGAMPAEYSLPLNRNANYQLITPEIPDIRVEYKITFYPVYNTGHITRTEYKDSTQLPGEPSGKIKGLVSSTLSDYLAYTDDRTSCIISYCFT